MINIAIAIGIALVSVAVAGLAVISERQEQPMQRTCPATSPNQERLAYSTYHHDGRLTCTYIVHEIGRAKRELTTGVPKI